MSHSLSHPEELTLTLLHFSLKSKTHKSSLKSCQIRAAKLPANQQGRLTTSTKDYPTKFPQPCSHLKPKIRHPSHQFSRCGNVDIVGQHRDRETQVLRSILLTHPNCRPPRTSTSPISAAHHSSLLTECPCVCHRKIVCCQTSSISILFHFPQQLATPACLPASFPSRGSVCQRMLALKLKGAQKEGKKEGKKEVNEATLFGGVMATPH